MSREETRQKLRELQADNPITDEEIVEAIRASRLDEGKSMNDWDELIRQLNALPGDWAIKISVASECYWSAEVRWTEEPNADGPDVSLVAFAVAGETPEEVAREAVDAILIRQNRAI